MKKTKIKKFKKPEKEIKKETQEKPETKIQEKQEKIKEKKYPYLYVYGIINKKDTRLELDIQGLKDKPIKKINFRDIFVLTGSYPALHPILNEDEAMQHANILKEIAKKTAVIPMAFGVVFKNKKILENILSGSYLTIRETLRLIENKIELGVKVVFKDQLDELDDASNGIASEILKSLNKLSVENINGGNFSDRLLLNHSFLIEKDKFSEFSGKIAELENKHKNLKFLYTGPWPPYSFVNIKITGGSG